MSRAQVVNATKDVIYGTGLGEKPSLRRGAASAGAATTGSLITFNLLADEGQYVKAGNVLARVSPAADTRSYVYYVLSVSTDAVTAVDAYHGAPALVTATDLNNALFEQNPLVPEYRIHKAIDTILARYLWPFVWKYNNYAVVPDLSDGQVTLDADVEEIESAYQIIGGQTWTLAAKAVRNASTAVASTGVLGVLDAMDGSSVYLTTKDRFTLSDTDTVAELIDLVALGAAAWSLDSSVAAAGLEKAKKEATAREVKARELWGSFLAMRSSWQEDLARDDYYFQYDRG